MPISTQSAAPVTSPLSACQSRYVARAVDVFSVVHLNQHADTLGPYGTVFFDSGADASFELPDCMSLNCILTDLRGRLLADYPPRAVVLFLPGLTNLSTKDQDCAVYLEVRERFRGIVLGTKLSDLRGASASAQGSLEMTVAPKGIDVPGDLLERIVAANGRDEAGQDAMVTQFEVPPVLRDLNCACQTGVLN